MAYRALEFFLKGLKNVEARVLTRVFKGHMAELVVCKKDSSFKTNQRLS